MNTRLAAVGAVLLLLGTRAVAHRLDEYLQATLISIEKDHLEAQIRLTPGVAVFPVVLAAIDTDADGTISETEQREYADRVLRDLSFAIDDVRLRPRLVSTKFPKIEEMKEGRGEIQLDLAAELPRHGPERRLVFENHHQRRIAAYLVNCLVPRDPDIKLGAQNRNYDQSFYELDYAQTGMGSGPLSYARWPGTPVWIGTAALLLFARFAFLLRFGRRRPTRAVNSSELR